MKTKIALFLYQYLPLICYLFGVCISIVAAFVTSVVGGLVTTAILFFITAALFAAGRGE